MKRIATALVILAAATASAQEFSALGEQFSLLRAQAQAQKQISQRPHAMGESRRFSIEQVPAAPAEAPDVSAYAVRGVDVSHYDGAISWGKAAAAGVSFAYIKATEGGDYIDDTFAANWKGAADAGVIRGAYHFYNFCRKGAEQADNFIKTVPADASALPPTIDLEESSSCKTMPGKASFRKQLAAFVAKVKTAYGATPILYINYSIYDKYFAGEGDSYKLWIADVSHQSPSMPENSRWTMWQYGWHGRVDGIPNEVDLDVFNGTPQMLAELEGPIGVQVAMAGPR